MQTATKVSNHILNTINRLENFPDSGSKTPDTWLNEQGYRMVISKKHVAIYRQIEDAVYIYHIADTQTENIQSYFISNRQIRCLTKPIIQLTFVLSFLLAYYIAKVLLKYMLKVPSYDRETNLKQEIIRKIEIKLHLIVINDSTMLLLDDELVFI